MTPSRPVQSPAPSRWRRIVDFLFPHSAERDPEFRGEIERLSVRSLYIIAAVCVGMPVVGYLFHVVTELFEPYPGNPNPWQVPMFFALSAALVVSARSPWGRKRARAIALLSGVAAAGLLIWFDFLERPESQEMVLRSFLSVVVVQLVAVVAIPALPWQIFALGAAIGWFHWFSAKLAYSWDLIPQVSLHYYAGMDLVTLLCTALCAVSYQRIHEEHRSHLREMEAQSRLLVSEHAASMGRFAATLSHELNTPIGALASAVDSIRTLESRKAHASAAEREQLEGVERELFKTATNSARHLHSVLLRMRRFTNLDRADVMPVDLSQLLGDVAAMVEPDTEGKVRIVLDCEQLPPLIVRPQQISAVFSNLLHHAVVSAGDNGRVAVVARRQNAHVKVIVRDEGPGYSPTELALFFEPGFKVIRGRVAGGNWGMFSSRQVVRQHGGDIEVHSEPGKWTEVTVTLPSEELRS